MRLRTAGTAAAVALAIGACSSDLAPTDAQATVDCLQATSRLGAAQARPAPVLRSLAAADGVTRTIAVWRRGDRSRPWAMLVVFSGAGRARDAAAAVPAGLRTTRRQNVIAVFGRRDRFGRAPTVREERRLKRCLSAATT